MACASLTACVRDALPSHVAFATPESVAHGSTGAGAGAGREAAAAGVGVGACAGGTGAVGVTAALIDDAEEIPAAFVAVTEKV